MNVTALRHLSMIATTIACVAPPALAQNASPQPTRETGAVVLPTIDVFATTPLSGTGVDIDKVPAGVTIIDAKQIEASKSASVIKALAQQTPSITINEVAGNPFQPDVEFRGFDASPVSGTPQGLAVYQNGVRINEAFGDSVNWDLIPTAAVRSIDVISNNPAGYFQNVGDTRRQGVEAEVNFKADRFSVYANYAFVDATFRTALLLSSNSPFADADGNIQVVPGDRLPMIPRHRIKLGGEYALTADLKVGAELVAVGPQYYVGDESNQAQQLPGYAVVNADASYQITKNVQIYARVENVLNNRYYSYGTFFDTGGVPNFANGGAPFADPRSVSPVQPRSLYAGMKATF
jgi:outer membrane receptor protein involved in Fe transport